MEEKKMVKDIMAPIDEYDKIDEDSHLSDALSILKKKHEGQKTDNTAIFHKTMFVTDASKKIVGKLSMYDLIRELVPETAREPEVSRAFYSALSSRVLEVSEEVSEFQQRFQWLHHSFGELVKQEAHKKSQGHHVSRTPHIEGKRYNQSDDICHVQRKHPPAPGGTGR